MKVRGGWLVATLIASGANGCGHGPTQPTQPTQPAVVVFSGTFTLAQAGDWVAYQACNYVIPMDQTVCDWGRLTVTTDQVLVSVRGFDVHQGGVFGPLIFRDSIIYTVALRVLDPCSVAIDSTGVTPNGRGALRADTLRFAGRGTLGESLSWAYKAVQVQHPMPCA